MSTTSVWQSNYSDLCEDSAIRFGAECVICGARYATPIETIDPELVASATPGSPLAQEIADLKYQRFTEFDSAFRELSITCFRCGKAACPDCWDDDNRMCAECVVARGLTRSPRVGPPGREPLQDGRLERIATGRYSDVGRPAWLNQLMQTEAARAGFVPPARPPAPRAADSAMPLAHGAIDQVATASLVMPVPFEPADPRLLASETTQRVPTAGPAVAAGDILAASAIAHMSPAGARRPDTNEGSATSNMVTCPRCGTANYDFVTRCTVCQLQLIQICPACEKLNAGHIIQCEFCGAALRRPEGWSDVQAPIQLVPAEEVPRKRRTAAPPPAPLRLTPPIQAPFIPEPQPRGRRTTRPVSHTGAPVSEAAAFAMPAMPAFGPFETQRPPLRQARRSRSLMDVLINGTERLASLILVAAILVVVGGIIAAELSPAANSFIASLIHVNVKITIDHFLEQMQRLTQRQS